MERREVEDFRRGTEVKFQVSEKRPINLNYRFWAILSKYY